MRGSEEGAGAVREPACAPEAAFPAGALGAKHWRHLKRVRKFVVWHLRFLQVHSSRAPLPESRPGPAKRDRKSSCARVWSPLPPPLRRPRCVCHAGYVHHVISAILCLPCCVGRTGHTTHSEVVSRSYQSALAGPWPLSSNRPEARGLVHYLLHQGECRGKTAGMAFT